MLTGGWYQVDMGSDGVDVELTEVSSREMEGEEGSLEREVRVV
jgi:hypothetical protein